MEDTHLNDIQLFEYANGELDDGDRLRADGHIAHCDECRSLLTLAESGASALQSSPRFDLRAERLSSTINELGPQEKRETRGVIPWRRWLTVLAPVAAVAGVVVIVVIANNGGDSGASESAAPAQEAVAEAAAPTSADGEGRALQGSAQAADEAAADAALAEPDSADLFSEAAPAEAPSAPTVEAASEDASAAESAPAPAEEPARAEEPAAASPAPAAELAPSPAEEPAPSPAVPEGDGLIASVTGPAEVVVAFLATMEIESSIAPDGAVEVAREVADATAEALAAEFPAGPVVVRVIEGG
jgi:hypothetical protein